MRWGRIIIYAIIYYILMALPTIPFTSSNPPSLSIYGYIGGIGVAFVAGYLLITHYLKVVESADPLMDGIKVALFFLAVTVVADFIFVIKWMGFSYDIGFLIWYAFIILAGVVAGLRKKLIA